MTEMNYNARTRIVFDFLYRDPDGVLRRYKVPDFLGDDQLRAELNDLVKDINGEIPSNFNEENFQALMPEIHRAIRRRHAAQAWPPAKTFILATQEAVKTLNASRAREQRSSMPNEGEPDPQLRWANRMKAGEPVAETFLWGLNAVKMVERNLTDLDTLETYRKSAHARNVEEYGQGKADARLADLEARHAAAMQDSGNIAGDHS